MDNLSKIDEQITAIEKKAGKLEKESLEQLWRQYTE
jgi:hypothetical protein